MRAFPFLFFFLILKVYIIEAQQFDFQKIGLEQGIPSARVNDFLEDSRGFFWLATEGAGLVRYDGFEFQTIPFEDENLQPIVIKLEEDSEGNIWLLSGDFLLKYDGTKFITKKSPIEFIEKEGEFRLKDDTIIKGNSHQISSQNGLPREDWNGIYQDRAGVIWLYSNNGLTKLETTAIQFFGETSDLDTEINTISPTENGFVAGTNRGLAISNNGKTKKEMGADFPFGVVLAAEKFAGFQWFGTEKGLIRFNGNSFKTIPLASTGDFIFSLKKSENALWIGTGGGIWKYQNGRAENVSENENLPLATVYQISEAADGSLWFGTYVNGFFRKDENDFRNLKNLGEMRLDSLRFNAFAAVSKSEIWASSLSEGLFLISEKGAENIAPARLGFAEIRSLAMDENGNLWAGTNQNLLKIKKTKNNFLIETVFELGKFAENGAAPNAISIEDNELYLGTSNGVLHINLNEYLKPKPEPKLAITNAELFFGESEEKLSDFSEEKMAFSRIPQNLKLPHDQNFLSFTLSGLTGFRPEKLEYRYKIKDSDADWTYAGNRREAVFSNLKSGSYNFQAQVSRPDGEWVSTVSYPFEIRFPLWQRWWFIALFALFIIGVTFWIVRDRVNRANQRLRLENSLMEMERKALRLQMNPHFIFNALDSISSFIFKNDPKQAVRYLNNFAKLMRGTLESSMEHLHPVETEVSILRNYLELEKLRFQGKFDFQIVVDEEIDYDVGIPPMLIQPHVENAILHGLKPKKTGGELSIRFTLAGDFLICEIEDNGIGRKASKALPKRQDHRSMATQINRDRLRLLRLSMNEHIDIQIIDKENPTGTKVVLKLPAEGI